MQQQTCSHKTCQKIRQFRNSSNLGGIGIAYLVDYNNTGHYAIMLGKEKSGAYQGLFNLCAGSVEKCDGGCYIKAAIRESSEEFKICINQKDVFDKVFKNKQGKVRLIMHNKTPIFVGVVKGLSRKQINPIIKANNQNTSLPHSMREMSEVDYFWISNKQQIEGTQKAISTFASGVISKIDINKL
jgi:hypothetical protein